METSALDFDLPPDLIAQEPPPARDASRLLHYRRADRAITHRTFSDLPALLQRGDLLVMNNTRVIPARFVLRKPTGGRIDALFVAEAGPGRWRVLLKNLGIYRGPLVFEAAPLSASVADAGNGGAHTLQVDTDEPAASVLARIGRMPLPPYIKRATDADPRDPLDRERYQTIFAQTPSADAPIGGSSVAAPTAGLHFTPALFDALDRAGVERATVTLEVGLGTFKPVTTDQLDAHAMHTERYDISPQAATAINTARQERRRVVAVGTTTARVLESQPADRPIEPGRGETSIFIYPPYKWRHVDALITNFHLPRSTLIALVAALIGLDEQRRVYAAAIAERYKFFSYGDAMLIE